MKGRAVPYRVRKLFLCGGAVHLSTWLWCSEGSLARSASCALGGRSLPHKMRGFQEFLEKLS